MKLNLTEIFFSIQGESTQAGRPCVFIRLTGCPLRCTYCDTGYAFFNGKETHVDEILEQIKHYPCDLVEVTGGEPLAQANAIPLMQRLLDEGYEVMLETSGALPIVDVPKEVRIIMDLKTPSSKENSKNLYDNIQHLKQDFDEVKYVIETNDDFNFCVKVSDAYDLWNRCTVLASPSFGKLKNETLANWIIDSGKPFRMQFQMHKYIWDPKKKGV